MQKYRRHSKDKMYALIRKWEKSGLSQEQFFRTHEIAKSTFGYWRKKYLKETGRIKEKESFIPVKIGPVAPKKNQAIGTLELFYPNGVRLVCSENMDFSRLKPLIIL